MQADVSRNLRYNCQKSKSHCEKKYDRNSTIAHGLFGKPSTPNLSHKKREREYNKIYHLPKDDALIRVCKVMFEETFGVSQKKCAIVLKKKEEMSLGHERKKKIFSYRTKKEVRKKVKSHIEKFPSVSSHYRIAVMRAEI